MACAGGETPGFTATFGGPLNMDTGGASGETVATDPSDSGATSTSVVETSEGDTSPNTAETDTSQSVCGDNTVDADEICDGSDLADNTCAMLGFTGGELSCMANCADYDVSGCVLETCGDDVTDGDDVCDGNDVNSETCVSQGFDAGALACAADCGDYDLGACTVFSCGNDMLEGVEVCDGAQLAGASCMSQGFDLGALSCAAGCAAYDTSACMMDCLEEDIGSALGNPATTGTLVGADGTLDVSCGFNTGVDHIVTFTAPLADDYVITTQGTAIDTVLAAFSSCDSAAEVICNDDAIGLQSSVTVTLAAAQSILISVESYDGATGPFNLNINPAMTCAEEVLVATGASASSGTTVGEDEDFGQTCALGGAVDHLIAFTASATGLYVFDTFGSGYDTALATYSGCSAALETACNDDAGGGLQSQLTRSMTAGEIILLSVNGYSGNTGAWVLNITAP